ncbi:hypothetical protein HNV12_13900 [Methanococcoides sp. SA1]|nr:hypothetical protein [Methanococcoides sp. SA1]
MNYWHIQLHPNDKGSFSDQDIIDILEEGVIGIDIEQSMTVNFDKSFRSWKDSEINDYSDLFAKKKNKHKSHWDKTILNFRDEIQIDDIVLVRNGGTPIALVKIVSDYFFSNNNHNVVWFRHRRNIQVLSYYIDYVKNTPENKFTTQRMGTLTRVDKNNVDAETNSGIITWHNNLTGKRSSLNNQVKSTKSVTKGDGERMKTGWGQGGSDDPIKETEYFNLEVKYRSEDSDLGILGQLPPKYRYYELMSREEIQQYLDLIGKKEFGERYIGSKAYWIEKPTNIDIYDFSKVEAKQRDSYGGCDEAYQKASDENLEMSDIYRRLGRVVTPEFKINLKEIVGNVDSANIIENTDSTKVLDNIDKIETEETTNETVHLETNTKPQKKASRDVSFAAKNTPPVADDIGLIYPKKDVFFDKDEIIKLIESKVDNNFWWLNANTDWRIDNLQVGMLIPYGVEEKLDESLISVSKLKKGDFLIAYQSILDKSIKGILQVDSEVFDRIHNGDNHRTVYLKLVYKFRQQTVLVDLLQNSLMNGAGLTKISLGSFKKIDFDVFKGIIDTTELSEDHADVQNESKIPNYLYDASNGDDYLDIDKDVVAFSKIMASKNLNPPLAIALFGKWGSGKSFFMNKLNDKIRSISDNEKDEKNPDYCRGVAQIHFNAWSYLDANLWASIVCQIFEGLDEYITGDSKAKKHQKFIKKELSKKLNISREEKDKLENDRRRNQKLQGKLENSKNKLQGELNTKIKTIKESSYKCLIDQVNSSFKVEEKIEKALSENKSIKHSKDQLDQLISKEYLDQPAKAYEELSSKRILFKDVFSKSNWFATCIIILVSIVLFFFVPQIVVFLVKKVGIADLSLPKNVSAIIISLTPLVLRFKHTFTKLQPLITSFYKIKSDYDIQIAEAKNQQTQLEKSLTLEIEQKRNEIDIIDAQIYSVKDQMRKLEFNIENALATQSLYSFIDERSNSKEYDKHLGIISLIRKDFEILSELFEDSNNESEGFRGMFDKPLERIILYIDDLDRCPEERVIEVLEAVNLLMAFPLFVVVVGVDPRWVNNALIKRYQLQFAGQVNGNTGIPEIKKIEASNYLEKIFQVPFHLKEASDEDVKKMIRSLNPLQSETQISSDVEDNVLDYDNVPDYDYRDDYEADLEIHEEERMVEEEFLGHSINYGNGAAYENGERLELSEKEIELMQDLSWLIGNNPRTVKRFVNTYHIVRAHEGLQYNKDEKETEFLIVMFLLALSFGPFREKADLLFNNLINNRYEGKLNTVLPFSDPSQVITGKMVEDHVLISLLDVDLVQFRKHYNLTKRFTFNECEIN